MWKDVPGWEHRYEASDTGKIRNKNTGHLIIGDENNMGYNRVTFYHGQRRERVFRHRLIAKMFIDNPNGYDEVNHIDEDKSHNSSDNLEWVTRTMNERANHRSQGKPYTPFTVWFCDGTVRSYEFAIDLAEELGVTSGLVHHWLKGRLRSYRHYGIDSLSYD